MLNRDINKIIYQGYIKLGEIAYDLATAAKKGNEGTSTQRALWNQAIYIDSLLDTIADHIQVEDNTVYRIIGIEVKEMNSLLACLKQAANIIDLPVASFIPTKKLSKIIVANSSLGSGLPGTNGQNAYIAVAYAEAADGSGFSTTPSGSTTHIAFKSSTTPIIMIASSFSGLWIDISSEDGNDGNDGDDGTSVYPYIRYATDDQGTGFSSTPNVARKYVAFLISTTDLGNNPNSSLFAGLWTQFIGSDGQDGEDGEANTILCGDGPPTSEIGINGDVYIDTTNMFLYAPKLNGAWPVGKTMKGDQGDAGDDGDDGEDGDDGDDGINSYLYIAYATDASGSNYALVSSSDPAATLTAFDTGKDYVAFLLTSTSIATTIAAGDFVGRWTKYQGSGDKWTTSSTSTLTIGIGTIAIQVEKNLAYSVGQNVVVADITDFNNRMEGFVVNYNSASGMLILSISNDYGAGTISAWAVSLQAFTVDPPTTYAGASPSTVTVNDLPVSSVLTGLTYDTLFEHIFAPFVAPTFPTLVMTGQLLTVEVGTTISGNKDWTWTSTQPANIVTNSLDLTDHTNGLPLVTGMANDGAENTVAITSVTKTTPATHTWRLTGTNTNAGTFFKDFTVSWLWRKYHGTSANTTLTEAQIEALVSSSLSDTEVATYSFAAGDYKYFAWPDSFGSPTASTGFKDTATNLAVAMADVTDDVFYTNNQNGWYYGIVSVTNTLGQTTNYRVYRTKNTLGATINIQVS